MQFTHEPLALETARRSPAPHMVSVGDAVGDDVGVSVGDVDGAEVGDRVGAEDGLEVGERVAKVGEKVGDADGVKVGELLVRELTGGRVGELSLDVGAEVDRTEAVAVGATVTVKFRVEGTSLSSLALPVEVPQKRLATTARIASTATQQPTANKALYLHLRLRYWLR